MSHACDLSRSLTAFDQDSTLIAVIEMSLNSWLVAGIVPGITRAPLKKLAADEHGLVRQLLRWRDEATKAGGEIKRLVVAFEAGRDGFWLARWLRSRGIEAYVIHAASVAVPREHRRPKTDRLDTEMLKRAFLGWLRGEAEHCQMVAIPTLAEEDARRPNRERDCLVRERTRIINRMKAALIRLGIRGFNPKLRKAAEQLDNLVTPEGEKLQQQPASTGPHAMVRLLARIVGVGIETADMLVHEILMRKLRDHRALARYAGLTGSPDESGSRRRDKGLARAGNGRVRRGMIQLAWRFLRFQRDSALTKWYEMRTKTAPNTRKTMIVALARKLLIALWRFAIRGAIPEGVALHAAA
jgi:transposase